MSQRILRKGVDDVESAAFRYCPESCAPGSYLFVTQILHGFSYLCGRNSDIGREA